MSDDLRARMRAVFAAKLSNGGKVPLRRNSFDCAKENAVTSEPGCYGSLSKEINAVTLVRPFSTNKAKPEPAEPSLAYHAVSTEPDDPDRKVFGVLQLRPPAYVPEEGWRQCVQDGKRFLAKWGEQAEALGWTSADLFGLHTPPAKPHPSYSRLSRYDAAGLCWLLQGREVIALTADSASIRNPRTGNVTVYRKHNKPALGDALDDLDPGWRQ
jgi:hypothetical protein